MFIKDFKKAEINLKILQRDRRAANIEWQRCEGLWEKTSGQFDKEEARLARERRKLERENRAFQIWYERENCKLEKEDRKLASENRRNEVEWGRTKGEWERTVGQFEKNEIKNTNTMEWSPYMKVKRFLDESYPEYASSLLDSLSDGQYESKRWMSEVLKSGQLGSKDPLKIEIAGSWFGWPMIELLEDAIVKIDSIDLYDIDEICHEVVRKYIYHFKPKYNINQYHDFFERGDKRIRHLIICTSCEHMPDISEMKEYYKDTPKPILALQSNDYVELAEHENCVNSYSELAEKNEIKDIKFQGERDFGYYKRFMVIGTW